jgi:hypothetical protein
MRRILALVQLVVWLVMVSTAFLAILPPLVLAISVISLCVVLRRVSSCLCKNLRIVTAVGGIATMLTLIFVLIQTHSIGTQTSMIDKQTTLLQEEYLRNNRPYIAIEDIHLGQKEASGVEDIQLGQGKAYRVEVMVEVILDVQNYGVVPATDIELKELRIYSIPEYGDYPSECWTQPDGVEICVSYGPGIRSLLVDISQIRHKMFYPNRLAQIKFSLDESEYAFLLEDNQGTLELSLEYSWDGKHYRYQATLSLRDGKWTIVSENDTTLNQSPP